jgi:xylulose-5-phosphate/fructose-6-phosphate phosphoketolase
MPEWFTFAEAAMLCKRGLGIVKWASTDKGSEPDAVLACAGDVPTLESFAAASILRKHLPNLKLRFVNVVDLMTLRPRKNHPHGLEDKEFERLFTKNKPITFAFHGYSSLIHRITYSRPNHENLHVYGYQEEGTTTTPFDMTVLNSIDRYHLVQYVVNSLPKKGAKEKALLKLMDKKLAEHRKYVVEHGEDLPEIRNWRWLDSSASREQ